MKRTLLFLGLFIGFCQVAISQNDTLFFTNSNTWDEERYPNVQGSPYFFEEFVTATITRRDSFTFNDVLVNLNGYEKAFEVREGDRYITLEDLWYRKIEILAEKNPGLDRDVIFGQDLHPTYKGKFAEVIFSGKNITLINDFHVEISEKTVQNVGKAETFERFIPINTYRLIKDGNVTLLRPKKDAFANALGSDKELSKFLKANKIKKLTDKQNALRVMEWYDEILDN